MRAMTSRVEILQLGQKDGEDVCAPKSASIDFDTLTQYKGDGKCREVHCNHMCIGWSDDDSDDSDWLGNIDISPEGRVERARRKSKWLDATITQTWAEKMNWDIQTVDMVKIGYIGYLLSKKI